MTVVDYIDLDDDACFVKVDFVDLSTDEDSVEKDGNVPEDDNVARSENVAKASVSSSISEEDAIPMMPLSKLEQEHAATASLSIVGHGAATASVMEEESMQPEHQKFLTTSDAAKEATRSENHGLIAAGHLVGEVMQSEHEQVAATSMLLSKQGAITSSLKEDSFMQFGKQVFVVALDHAKEATQSESTVKAAGSPSMTERGTTCKVHRVGQLYQMIGCPYIIGDGLDLYSSHGGGHPQGEPGSSTLLCTKSEVSIRVRGVAGNAMGSTGINNIHAQEKPDQNCDFEAEAEAEALCQEVSQDVFAMSLSPQDKEKKIIQLRKFYDRKGKKQVNASATEHNRQLRIVHSNRVLPPLHNGNVLNGEVVVSTYQGCRTSQGNTVHDKVHNNDSQGCMVEGCTNGAHGSTPLCVFHNSRPHKRCCAVVGCTKAASSCKSSVGRTDRCIKHGGGKRCKYDGCGKGAQGNTDYCITHGGGRRCKSQGCRKSAQGRSDYCVEHGGGRRCKYEGCSESRTCMKGFCSTHITYTLSGNNSGHEMLPEPAPACWAKKAERSKGRKSCSVAGGRAQKRQNTNDYVLALEASVSSRRQRKRQSFIC